MSFMLSTANEPIMLSVVMLNVVILSVEAPTHLDAPKAAAQVKLPQTLSNKLVSVQL